MKNFDSLLVAYLAVWAIFFVYHIAVARRVSRLGEELNRLREQMRLER